MLVVFWCLYIWMNIKFESTLATTTIQSSVYYDGCRIVPKKERLGFFTTPPSLKSSMLGGSSSFFIVIISGVAVNILLVNFKRKIFFRISRKTVSEFIITVVIIISQHVMDPLVITIELICGRGFFGSGFNYLLIFKKWWSIMYVWMAL